MTHKRRHHNTKGLRQIKRGKTFYQLRRICKKLGLEERLEKMPILDSELNDASVFALIPNSIQNARVCVVDATDPKDPTKPKRTGKGEGQGTMATLDWEITSGEYAGRKIRYDNIMTGGLSKEGKPLSLGQLCSFLHYTGVRWQCKDCGAKYNDVHSFYIGTAADKANGLRPSHFYCSACKNPKPRIIYDTDDFMGAMCGIAVRSKKQEGTDKEFNEIGGYCDPINNV